ncbi:Ankyrin repeat domain-containing 50 [Paramuricea clavata]|uniref:Ankyrin repeat domain-containing 50 n=1 Tax=Paramuricea clavata TaxID=317549 RepID=A0A7D9HJ01_PARCT|nr:Ankyrin repeat domain-containing 50 [Paramuricea clavata]
MSSNRLKSNGAKLSCLIIDQGTETMRKYLDSIHSPANLPAVLNANRATLNRLHTRRVINLEQMNLLFPPPGMPPTTSSNYDITLLFILIRNICGLTPPRSTRSWDANPPSFDITPEANLARIKYYRNVLYAHKKSTEVSDTNFNIYWSEIENALVGLGANIGDVTKLKTNPFNEDLYINLLNEWYEKDHKIEVLGTTILKKTETIEESIKWMKAALWTALFILVVLLFYLVLSSHLGIEEVDYSYRQNVSNPGFVGREWVFREIQLDMLNASDVRGVLLVADPGWGKSAIMKRLINTSSSSAIIHENIIGYHFCKYNEKSTRDGERFVRNLVQLISKKIDEFQEIIDNDQLIKDELQSNCEENPIECFQKAIVEPLQKLNATGRNNSFILIDALDECLEKEEGHNSVIVNILSRRLPKLPTWVKVIVTSRKQALTSGKISKINGFSTLKINVQDQRNLHDLRTYAQQSLQNFYTEVPSTKEKLPLNHSIDLVVEFSKGNFLLLKTIINYWQEYPDQMNARSIPESLEDIYKASFAERFKEAELIDFEPLLEVLLAANSPPTLLELGKILNYHYKNHNTRRIVNKLSQFFTSDIDQGSLEFHHQFFAEWLINQTDGSNGIFIEKSRGHQYIVDYLFHFYSERQTEVTFKELSELCIHILHGEKASVSNRRKLSSLKVSEVKGSRMTTTLHDLASRRDATGLIDVLIKQFKSVDILDLNEWTPAMYAVDAGSYENVKLFIDNGANVNYTVKTRTCFYLDFIDPSSYFLIHGSINSMSSIAAYRGYTKIAELLIKSGANIEKADECGWKALYLAALMGQFEIVQLYINKGAKPDLVSLHHAAARNHTETVRVFLNNGVRDKCLPCKPGNKSWCTMNVNQFHHCFCETALHAAVSRNNLEVAKLIVWYGNASVNCKHGSGQTPLMEAFSQKNTQMAELLISEGADINAKCESSILSLVYDCADEIIFIIVEKSIYSHYCNRLDCNGSDVIDFSFAHGLWEMMIPFISKGKLNASSSNTVRWSPTTIAVIYDRIDFISATYGNKIYSVHNIETMLRYVAVCNSVEILRHLLNSGDLSKFAAVYEDGKTLLHFATLGSSQPETETYVTQSCAFSACVCPNRARSDITEEKRLETVRLLLKVLVSDINKKDKYGRTALHYAAVHGLPTLVEYLVNAGADWSIKDHWGDTALEFALREKPILSTKTFLPCRLTSDQVFEVCQSTRFDELANYLLQNATIKKCNTTAKSLLGGLLRHKLPLSLYALFKSGLDINCAHEQFKEYLSELSYDEVFFVFSAAEEEMSLIFYGVPAEFMQWRRRDFEPLEVFKIFQINVEVTSDVPFAQSELHLMAYLRTSPQLVGNLFQPSVNNTPFPIQRFIASHPKGVEILNQCYDKEGYLAIHRAVQGVNLPAVSWFIEIGADLSKKTKSGLTALALAIVNLKSLTLDSDIEYIFDKLLEKMQEKSHAVFQCNTEHVDLSPLHVAGSRSVTVVEMVHRKIPALPLNCTNSDGIQPIYLACLYNATVSYNWWKDEEAFQYLGLSLDKGPSNYPEREAEYHLIYNQFYRTPQEDLRDMLNHEGLFECPGINELLPNKTEIKEYIKIKTCPTRCWRSAFKVSREFSSNFPYVDIQNFISNPFTDKFIDIAHHMAELRFHLVKMFHFSSFRFISISTLEKELWRKVIKAHSCAHNCSCFEIMQLLQEKFTSEPWYDFVGKFVAERMGWTDTSSDGDVKYRWPFGFLLKKALRTDKAYKYLEILSPHFNRDSIRESLRKRPTD